MSRTASWKTLARLVALEPDNAKARRSMAVALYQMKKKKDALVEFKPITGEIPSPLDPPAGCTFHPRCPLAEARCRNDRPCLRNFAEGRLASCHLV